MVSVDENTKVAMEIVSQGTKLSEELILKVLQSLTELFKQDNGQQNFIAKDNTKEGKQRIKELVGKHKDGVMALDENISREQLKDYQNEFKKMGVDFSVIKNSKDNYSFFFASKDANIIEKSLKNVIEKKSLNLEKENTKKVNSKEGIESEEKSKQIPEKAQEKVPERKEEIIQKIFNDLSPAQQAYFLKMNEVQVENQKNIESLNEFKKDLTPEEVISTEKIYKENVFTGNEEVTQDKIFTNEIDTIGKQLEKTPINSNEKAVEVEAKETNIEIKFNELDSDGQKLFTNLVENDDLLRKLPPEDLQKAENLFKEYKASYFQSKEEQLDNIFKQLSPEEKEFFIATNDFMLNTDSENHKYKFTELKEQLTDAQVDKVNELYEKNIHDTKDEAPMGMIHMNDVEKIAQNLSKEVDLSKDVNSVDAVPSKNIIDNQSNEDIVLSETNFGQLPEEDSVLSEINFEQLPKEKAVLPEKKEEQQPKNKIDAPKNELEKNKLSNQKERKVEKEKSPPIYSVKGVKEINTIIKEKDKNNDKDKKRTKSHSR